MRKLGLVGPDLKDNNDYIWSVSKRLTLPKIANLSSRITRIEEQSELGSCVAHAATSVAEYNDKQPDNQYTNLSRLMLYADCRLADGTDLNEDSGTYLRTAIKVLNKAGTCKEDLWPYDTSKFNIKPAEDCYADAKTRRIKSYHRIISSFDMKACLAAGRPFILGIPIYPSFMTEEVAVTGEVPMPKRSESILGYHAVYCAGFNDNDRKFTCVNSWGKNWGKAGTFALPYKYIEKYVVPMGMGDCWCVFR